MTTAAEPDLDTIFARLKTTPEALAAFCKENGIQRLRLFGSVVRDDFDPEKSDVDALVDFEPEVYKRMSLFDLVGAQLALQALLGGRRVDLLTDDCIGKYLRRHILPSAREIYVAAA